MMQNNPGAEAGISTIDMEVFSNRLLSVTDEMSASLIKSSFSTNIKERKDCSVGLFDAQGQLIAQASNIPLHLGSLKGSVDAVLATHGPDEIAPGDAFICNDPYLAGGTHTPDISIVTPVFIEGVLEFFAANIGHHTDVGGPSAGSTGPTMRSIFWEGLRIPVMKIVRAGDFDEALLRMISVNSRDPMERTLDLRVQVSTNQIGARALLSLVASDGIEKITALKRALLAYTERRLAGAIEDLPDGTYRGEAFMDHDGLGGEAIRIAVAVTVAGNRLLFDFDGTSRQARGGYNIPESALHATCFYAIKSLLDPALPPNAGMFGLVDITAPEGTLVNPVFPAATGSRSNACQKVARAIFLALTEVLPESRQIAPSADMNGAIVFSGLRKDGSGRFVYLETVAGGSGAMRDLDGQHAVQVHITNSSNLPAEAMELEYPLIVEQYALAATSTGEGRARGGAGIIRDVTATEDGIVASVRCDGMSTPAPGLHGGGPGGPARLGWRDRLDTMHWSEDPITDLVLKRGEGIRLETPGGAGFGPASERPDGLRAADARDGFGART